MPQGEAAREGITALMAVTSSVEVLSTNVIPGGIQAAAEGPIIPYVDADNKAIYGVVLVCRDTHGNETGRMIAIIRAVTTKQEEDEAQARFTKMNRCVCTSLPDDVLVDCLIHGVDPAMQQRSELATQ